MHFEAVDLGLVAAAGFFGDEGWVDLEEDVVERGAEVGAVDGGVARGLGVVEVFAFGAVELYAFLVRDVGEAHGEEGVVLAHYAGAFAEVAFFVFFEL